MTAGSAAKAPSPVVDPGVPGGPPSDAIVLFDGTDLSKWRSSKGGPAKWEVKDGVVTCVPGTGDLVTKDAYGDCQLHLEWAVPPRGTGGSNSGIKFHQVYEIQIIDSYGKSNNPLGQAAAVYKQHAPLVNVCRKPGEWERYDIVFRAPVVKDGAAVKPGRFTVFHNGVLIHDNVPFTKRTNSGARLPAGPKEPFFLQDHGGRVRFRNIWIRELPPRTYE
jgi:hypothetical protein